MIIPLLKLLDLLFKKDDTNLTQIREVTCCGYTHKIVCKTIKLCREELKKLKIIEDIKKLENLSKEQEEERQKVLKKFRELERKNNFKGIEF
jgi:DNA-binding transcriptional MerR regulator